MNKKAAIASLEYSLSSSESEKQALKLSMSELVLSKTSVEEKLLKVETELESARSAVSAAAEAISLKDSEHAATTESLLTAKKELEAGQHRARSLRSRRR